MNIIFPIGISGSGKTLLGNKLKELYPKLEIICMDDIRKQHTGNISDQSQNAFVYKKSQTLMHQALALKANVYMSATNLNTKKDIISTIDGLQKQYKNLKSTIVFMEDGLNIDLCLSRIKLDMENKVDRSIIDEDTLLNQYNRFIKLYKESWLYDRTNLNLNIFKYGAFYNHDFDSIVSMLTTS